MDWGGESVTRMQSDLIRNYDKAATNEISLSLGIKMDIKRRLLIRVDLRTMQPNTSQ